MPCMHCEHAPCEPVCPVAASVHDSEGLNLQVYNRCVGTRFCESNCPYKVRRFNFFGYADGEEYKSFGDDIVKAVFNPDVTVRGRGVMEKCTYCVQRISRARRAAEKEHRAIRDGEVVTACQAACPTRAISFRRSVRRQSRDQRAARTSRRLMRCSANSARGRAPLISPACKIPIQISGARSHERGRDPQRAMPPEPARWTLPPARSSTAVNEIVTAPLLERERGHGGRGGSAWRSAAR